MPSLSARNRRRSQAKRLFVWLLVAALAAASTFVGHAGTPYEADPDRLDAVRATPAVAIEERPGGYVLRDADARFEALSGVTHAQFGAYGPQFGDREPAVSDREARRTVANLLVAWFRERSLSSRSSAAAPASPRTGRS